MEVVAAEEYFHMDSVACWLPAAAGIIALVVSFLWATRPGQAKDVRRRLPVFGIFALVAVVSGLGSAFWYANAEKTKDARDQYVIKALAAGGVKFEDFQDEDTERVRVSRQVKGKKCSATFDVVLGDYGGAWPLKRGTGRYASDDCGVNDVDNDDGLLGSKGPGARAYYLDDIFRPGKGFKTTR